MHQEEQDDGQELVKNLILFAQKSWLSDNIIGNNIYREKLMRSC